MPLSFFNVVILIFSRNCVDLIARTLDSCRAQTFDGQRVKVVVVDNNSTDGTYEKVLEYAATSNIAVYRLQEQAFPTRLLRTADRILEYVDYKYVAVLNPGDVLYPDYVERCVGVMESHATLERLLLLTEVDLVDRAGAITRQTPLYTESGILRKRIHLSQFLTVGAGHRIQGFYVKGTFPKVLPDMPFCVDFADWFKKAVYAMTMECIYLKDAYSATLLSECPDKLNDLMRRMYLVKRVALVRSTIFAEDGSPSGNDADTQRRIGETLATVAITYAAQELESQKFQAARKLLLFAEMACAEIVNSERYRLLHDLALTGSAPVSLEMFNRHEQSVPLPAGALSLVGNA